MQISFSENLIYPACAEFWFFNQILYASEYS